MSSKGFSVTYKLSFDSSISVRYFIYQFNFTFYELEEIVKDIFFMEKFPLDNFFVDSIGCFWLIRN
jgi:hypothetical protein